MGLTATISAGTSRLIVEGDRFSPLAMERSDFCAEPDPRDISSRSTKLGANQDRLQGGWPDPAVLRQIQENRRRRTIKMPSNRTHQLSALPPMPHL